MLFQDYLRSRLGLNTSNSDPMPTTPPVNTFTPNPNHPIGFTDYTGNMKNINPWLNNGPQTMTDTMGTTLQHPSQWAPTPWLNNGPQRITDTTGATLPAPGQWSPTPTPWLNNGPQRMTDSGTGITRFVDKPNPTLNPYIY